MTSTSERTGQGSAHKIHNISSFMMGGKGLPALPASSLIAHDRYGGGSVMDWGGITMTGRTELHICQGNATGLLYGGNVIQPVDVSSACRHGSTFIIQTKMQRQSCTCCPRSPAVSQNRDSPMASEVPRTVSDYLWEILGRRVRRRPHKPQDISELVDAPSQQWRQIPQATIG